MHVIEADKMKLFSLSSNLESQKEGGLLYYYQISMKNFHQFDLLDS